MNLLAVPGSPSRAPAERVYGATSLRAWLSDRWAILFSHPEDFAQEQLEMDRWVSVLSRAFAAHGVAPVALARAGNDLAQGWLGGLAALQDASAAVLSLDPVPGGPPDCRAAALRTHIARNGPRLALLLDPSLRCRRALSYGAPAGLPSPLELIGWGVALRRRDQGASLRSEPASALPIRPGWMANVPFSIARAGL